MATSRRSRQSPWWWPWGIPQPDPALPPTEELAGRLDNVAGELEKATHELRSAVSRLRGNEGSGGAL